jgi:hypothetical protein
LDGTIAGCEVGCEFDDISDEEFGVLAELEVLALECVDFFESEFGGNWFLLGGISS